MSEWQDQQKANAKAAQDAVQRALNHSNTGRKRRKLDLEEKTRAARLKELIKAAKAEEFIENKTLKRWLTKDQFNSIAERWENEKLQREEWTDKPDEIREYEERLRQALFIYNRADTYSQRGKSETAQRFFSQADKLFERLLEKLQEIIYADPKLIAWFDRDTEWTFNSDLGLSPDQVPRVVTSRSRINQSVGFTGARQTKADIKLAVLKEALEDLIYEQADSGIKTAGPSSKLQQILNGADDEY